MSDTERIINHNDANQIASLLEDIGEQYSHVFEVPTLFIEKIKYDGKTHSVAEILLGYDPERMILSGDIEVNEEGIYNTYIQLKYVGDTWSDGTTTIKTLHWFYGNPFDLSILTKDTVTFDELLSVIDQDNSTYRSQMVGKLVTGMTNSLYSGAYRILGTDHDYTTNTFDLITEDCVQKASKGFGSSNRHYDDSGCYARIFAEETFYNAFDSSIRNHILPMTVLYAYSTSNGNGGTGTLRTLSNRYGKLLSYKEAGTTYASSGNSYDTFTYMGSDNEGTVYEYFSGKTGSTLGNLRIKKYNGNAVNWWLRSRFTNGTSSAGRIVTDGQAGSYDYTNTGYYLAPVLRIGNPS